MRVLMPPVIGSRRALGRLCARHAPLTSVSVRCVAPIAVKHATSVLVRWSGASRWTRRGSCARRACGLALPLMSGRASLAGGVVENRRSCLHLQRRSRAVGDPCRCASTVDRGPNQAFERTRRFSLSTWPMSVRRAAQLDRWGSWRSSFGVSCVLRSAVVPTPVVHRSHRSV